MENDLYKYKKYKNKYFKLLGQIGGGKCSFCKKEIPDQSLALHEVRCPRVNYICEICDQAVPKVKKESHAAGHRATECPDCGEELEERELLDHLVQCPERELSCSDCDEVYRASENHYCLVECPYCNDQIRANTIDEHLRDCRKANMTEKCHRCHKWIRVKNLEKHARAHQSGQVGDAAAPRPEQEPEWDCRECGEVFTNPSLYTVHRMTVHGQDRTQFNCPKCPLVFDLEDEMYLHLGYEHVEEDEED